MFLESMGSKSALVGDHRRIASCYILSAVDQTVLSEGSVWGDRVERMEGTTSPISWGSPWRLISNDVGVLDESFGKHLPEFLL